MVVANHDIPSRWVYDDIVLQTSPSGRLLTYTATERTEDGHGIRPQHDVINEQHTYVIIEYPAQHQALESRFRFSTQPSCQHTKAYC